MTYGMLAQSMLLTAFAILFAAEAGPRHLYFIAVELLIAIFGFVYSVIQVCMANEMLGWMTHLKEEYLSKDKLYFEGYLKKYLAKRRSLQRLVPRLLTGVWAVLALIVVIPVIRFVCSILN